MKPSTTELIRAEQKLANAHITLDISAIDDLLHEDYVIIQPGGKLETKQEVLDSYKTGNRHWNKAEVCDLTVKIYGDMARVIGVWEATGTNNEKPFDYKARFISVWVKRSDSWKNIAYTSSEIED